MSVLLFPASATSVAAPWRLGLVVPVLTTALILAAGVVVRALGGSPRRRRPMAGRRRLDRGERPPTITEMLTHTPSDCARIVLQTIALQAQSLTSSELAAAGIDGDATHPFSIWAHVGMPPEQVEEIGRSPRAVGLLGLIGRENRTVRLRDVRQHVDYRGLPPHHPPITSFLAVPIRFRGGVVGCLCLGNKQVGGEFTVEDQQMAEMLAARATGALDAAPAYEGATNARPWLQTVLGQMPEGVLVLDGNGEVVMDNDALRSFMGAKTSVNGTLDPRTIHMTRPSGDRLPSEELPVMRAVTDGEVTVGREFVVRGPDDRSVPLLVSAAPILSNTGLREGAVMICQDVSSVRSLQRVREEWASIVAHELRQPISVVTLRTSLLLRSQLSSEQRDSVEQIARSIHSLGRMVADLMDASLLESDRLRVKLARVDLGQLLSDVVQRTPLAAPRTQIHAPADACFYVKGDAQRLEQVISNLLSNSVKYAPPETDVVVDLGLAAGQAHIRVTNFGEPIPAGELPFIFNRFARTRAAGASGVTGLGLGLYIARGLVSAHHGRIWAESGATDGTTFHITLPLDGPPVPVEPPADRIRLPAQGGVRDTRAAARWS
jgi:signal transduction histidine kinase